MQSWRMFSLLFFGFKDVTATFSSCHYKHCESFYISSFRIPIFGVSQRKSQQSCLITEEEDSFVKTKCFDSSLGFITAAK